MNILLSILAILGFLLLCAGLIVGAIALYRHHLNFQRSLNMVFLRIVVPKEESKDEREQEKDRYSAGKDFKEVVGVMKHFFEALHSLYCSEWEAIFRGQEFLSFEYAVQNGLIDFYAVVPRHLEELIEKQITAFYPHSYVEKVSDYNIFKPQSKVHGCYVRFEYSPLYPIKTYTQQNSDPFNTLANAFSKLGQDDGAAIQIMVRPKKHGWQKRGRQKAKKIFTTSHNEHPLEKLKSMSWIGTLFDVFVHGPTPENMRQNVDAAKGMTRTTPLTDEQVKSMETKNTQPGFESIIRIVAASPQEYKADQHLKILHSAFAQYNTIDNNKFHYTKWHSKKYLVRNFIFRHFRRNWLQRLLRRPMILSSEELASLFHLPNIKYNRSPNINWMNYKIAPAPANLPAEGLLLGHNVFRGESKEVRIQNEDRFRHFYVIGQTGTGKSSIFQVMIRQDLRAGKGIAVIDPHGSLIEDILPFIPRERADDVIYFEPADLERPMGINLLEADTDEERDLVALDAMNIMIKLFNEEIFGPRIQDYFRNGCLTLMADPEGGSLTDIVRLFTDDDYQRYKTTFVKNPVVKSFWIHQMAKTGTREKQEMIPYFSAKFGQFVTNTMMRNIIGQAKSSFDFFKVMQEGKILLMNLSKGTTGEINSKLLGMIIVSKIQMAAMKRQHVSKEERKDFFLYIDEFQNYVTESIEVILSEARKYRLSLNMAHQYLAQLEGSGSDYKTSKKATIKDAVFGNVGSIMSYKIGAQDAEYMAKEFAPVFSDQDLINIDKFKAVMKLSIDGQPSRPFSVVPINPYKEVGDAEAAEAFKQLSRLKYGRDRDFVEREILKRIGVLNL